MTFGQKFSNTAVTVYTAYQFHGQQSWARDNCLASRQRQRNNVTEPKGPVRNQKKFEKQLGLRVGFYSPDKKWHLRNATSDLFQWSLTGVAQMLLFNRAAIYLFYSLNLGGGGGGGGKDLAVATHPFPGTPRLLDWAAIPLPLFALLLCLGQFHQSQEEGGGGGERGQ